MKNIRYVTVAMGLFALASISSCKKSGKDLGPAKTDDTPPKNKKENWLGRDNLMTRTFYDDQIAVYAAEDADTTIKWWRPTINKVWKYTKDNYGYFGDYQRLNIAVHGTEYIPGGYFMGQPVSYLDPATGKQNVIEIDAANWNDPIMIAVMTHEIGHIVEGASDRVQGSPSFNTWGDSKWQDIFIYDVFLGLKMTKEADAWYDQYQQDVVKYPRPGTQWFKNWWVPIYTQYGKTALLVKYFKLLADNFPKEKNANGSDEFTRSMNMGEFIHFWSGAAGTNLKQQATIAFGWSMEWEQQLKNAQEDFPNVKYTN
jgi:hypothetical protein